MNLKLIPRNVDRVVFCVVPSVNIPCAETKTCANPVQIFIIMSDGDQRPFCLHHFQRRVELRNFILLQFGIGVKDIPINDPDCICGCKTPHSKNVHITNLEKFVWRLCVEGDPE